jgi:UDP-N-acetylglucosamine 4,6-dehydratase
MKIIDLVAAVAPGSETIEIGIRPGEKLHEEMISPDDSRRTVKQKDKYVISPVHPDWAFTAPEGEALAEGFSYRSDTNDSWLSIDDLKKLIDTKQS